MPWARHDARFTRGFDDQVAWLACQCSKRTASELTRVSWRTVGRIVTRVAAEARGRYDPLDYLRRIGIDELSYRRGERYLTVVADHDRDGAVVWAAEGHDHKVLEAFYDELGEERTGKLQATSLDMGGAYAKATDNKAAHVQRCIDPFHVVKLCNDAIDKTRRWAWNEHRRLGNPNATWVKSSIAPI